MTTEILAKIFISESSNFDVSHKDFVVMVPYTFGPKQGLKSSSRMPFYR